MRYSSNAVKDLSESLATPGSARPPGSMIKPTMCIDVEILLSESEPLLLLHMPRTATFLPKTAHFVVKVPLFFFSRAFRLVCERASVEESGIR